MEARDGVYTRRDGIEVDVRFPIADRTPLDLQGRRLIDGKALGGVEEPTAHLPLVVSQSGNDERDRA